MALGVNSLKMLVVSLQANCEQIGIARQEYKGDDLDKLLGFVQTGMAYLCTVLCKMIAEKKSPPVPGPAPTPPPAPEPSPPPPPPPDHPPSFGISF